jgi:hypothetical protein
MNIRMPGPVAVIQFSSEKLPQDFPSIGTAKRHALFFAGQMGSANQSTFTTVIAPSRNTSFVGSALWL